jgi:outer membrane protein TolC
MNQKTFLPCLLIPAMLIGCGSQEPAFQENLADLYQAEMARRSEAKPETAAGAASHQQVSARADAPIRSLAQARIVAAANNQSLQAAFYRYKAAMQETTIARSLPDPTFSYTYQIRQVETRVGPQRQAFSLAQRFPWFGKLLAAGDAAAARAQAAHQEFIQARHFLDAQVTDQWADLAYLAQDIRITRENLELLRSVAEVLRTRQAAAVARRGQVIRIEVEIGKLHDRLQRLTEMVTPAQKRLDALMNRPAGAPPIDLPDEIPALVLDLEDREVFELAQEHSPRLAQLDALLQAAQAQTDLAWQQQIPDLTLGVTYLDTRSRSANVDDNGKDPVMIMAGINLPIWRDRIRAGIVKGRLGRLAVAAQKNQYLSDLRAQIQQQLFLYHDAQRRIELYRRDLLPKALEAVNVNRTAFSGGQADYNDLIDSQRVALEFQRAHQRALADRTQAIAQLEALAGTPLPVSTPAEADADSD